MPKINDETFYPFYEDADPADQIVVVRPGAIPPTESNPGGDAIVRVLASVLGGGLQVSLQVSETHIQWRLGTGDWVDLVSLAALTGAPGTPGANGSAISIQTTPTHIQWRLGDGEWANIIAIADLVGPEGPGGPAGEALSLQTTATHIQWRLGAGAWSNLIALAALIGPPGAAGEAVSLQTTATHIQWRLGTGGWANLIALADLKGETGAGLVPRGAFDSDATYAIGDFVSSSGRSFASLIDENTGNTPPDADADSTEWMWLPAGGGGGTTDYLELDNLPVLGGAAALDVGNTAGKVAAGDDARIVGAEQTANKNVAGGYAGLDGGGLIPSALLPSFVDDVVEFANLAAFPGTGTSGKIFVAIDTNKAYRWSGSAYTVISASPGSTDSVTEGSVNLYFTVARVRAVALTGLSLVTSTAITAADTVLTAFGKLQAQISARLVAASNLSDLADAPTAFGNIKQAATTAISGVVQLADAAAYRALTAGRAITTDAVAAALAEVSLTDASTIAWNMASGIDFTVTLGGNRTLGNPTNTTVGKRGRIRVVQDGTGGRTLAKSANCKTAGGTPLSLSTAAGAVDYIDYDCRSSTDIRLALSKGWS